MIKDIARSNENISINDTAISILKEHFSSCFKKDGSFDMERFKEELKDKVDVVHEGYELKFLGKSYAKLLASLDTTTVITPNTDHNNLPENKNSENIYISGDNLDGLKHLLKSYSKSVKCIYIDPPYNTGSDGFVYKDNFNFTVDELQDKLSVDETQAKRILDLTKRNSASHSAWLMFMYSRLQLANDLLKDDGVIFISIDDNEQANLKLLCDDIFGEECFVATFPWRKRTAKSDVPFGVSQDYESIISYSKKDFIASMKGGSRKYYESDDFPNRPWRIHDMTTQRNADERPNSNFTIVDPKSGNEYPVNPNAVWRVTTESIKGFEKENRIVYPGDYDFLKISKPVLRYFKEDDEKKTGEMFGFLPVSTNLPKEVGMSQDGTKDIAKLFDSKIFSFPKPVSLLKYLIESATNHDNNSLIVDFFSGSASSAQAVLDINANDKADGKRKFISIQLPEVLNPKDLSQKTAFDFLTSINRPTTLDYVGIERIIRASKKIKEETNAVIDYGFKHFILNEPNQNTLDKCETFDKAGLLGDATILDDFGTETVLTTWLNNDGYGLNAKVEAINLKGYTAYYCKKHLYLINSDFTQDAMVVLFEKYDTIAGFNPENIVLFGYSFNEWSVTEMLEKNLKILNDSEKNLKINIDVRY
ncbi:type III restriction endonuclease [Flavobacterium alvei]|uniref:site-specific DNA-methyltransferase (adenine-specific) n=1 Tax=Flavobacterium alvei TaxID=2080416 RepID=A0A2S5AEB0_9FLAO|nr:site-specific DNA-methyltransferase [Flavobacterium alvei]POY40920.1 type III restriction endonuclease [Flavobacterium alvei]